MKSSKEKYLQDGPKVTKHGQKNAEFLSILLSRQNIELFGPYERGPLITPILARTTPCFALTRESTKILRFFPVFRYLWPTLYRYASIYFYRSSLYLKFYR